MCPIGYVGLGDRGLIMYDVKATKLDAILAINPSAKFIIKDGTVEWLDGTSAISDTDIDAKVTELTTKNAHILPRSKAYPDLEEQLDLLWHAIDADAALKTKLAGFYNAIKTLKDANPKG